VGRSDPADRKIVPEIHHCRRTKRNPEKALRA
jgi:hypothetical protein